jgi:hypothetical protein
VFFFEKKNQKTFVIWRVGFGERMRQGSCGHKRAIKIGTAGAENIGTKKA